MSTFFEGLQKVHSVLEEGIQAGLEERIQEVLGELGRITNEAIRRV